MYFFNLQNCEITFEPYAGEVSRKRSHIPYTNGGWGGIPITLLDINKNAIKLSNGHIKKAGEMTSNPVNIQVSTTLLLGNLLYITRLVFSVTESSANGL